MKTNMSNLWKQLLVILTVVIAHSAFAQAPQKMSYQAVIRDNTNQLIANTAIGMQVSILQGSASGTAVYVETHTPTTNQNGLTSVELGSGTQVSGDFTTIDWSTGDYFIKIETDPTGGITYTITGTSQLLSVPYAFYAESTNETDPKVGSVTANKVPTWNGTTLVDGTIQDNATNIGVGTAPVAGNKLTVNGKTATTNLQLTNGATANYVLQSDASGNGTWVNPTTLPVTETDPQVAAATTNKIPKWNGTTLVDGLVTDDGTNVGVGTATPADKLHIVGNTRVDGGRIDFRNTGNSVLIGENAGLNDDLNNNSNVFIGTDAGNASITGSDNVAVGQGALENSLNSSNVAVGKGSFNNNINGSNNVGLGTNSGYLNNDDNNTFIGTHAGYNNVGTANIFIGAYAGYYETASDKLYIHNSDVTDPLIYGDFVERDLTFNGSVGIDTAPDAANKLTVNGNTATTNFQMTDGATANYVLQSDASGNATWVDPTTLTITETDPQVSAATTNRIPKWNGTTMVDGQITDNGTNVGIGTATPVAKLHVVGNTRIDAGKIDFRNTGNSVFIGENAGQNDDYSANNNVYVGFETGQAGVVANNNIAIGYQVLKANTADNNVAIGSNAMKNSTVAYQNVAIGSNALIFNVSGNYNVAIGNDALRSNNSGGQNVAIGVGALQNNNTGSGNVAIGREAGMNETGNNKLYIHNSNVTNPLIYGDFTSRLLTINGSMGVGTAPVGGNQLTIAGKTATTNLQMTNGATANYVLQSDASGNATWVNPATLAITEADPQVASATVSTVPRWNGTTLVDGIIQDDATNVGIGTTPVPANMLTVAGKTATTNLQMTNGATTNYVLRSDATGNATWVNPTSLAISENDPQVSSSTSNKIPKWNGSTMVDGQITDNGTKIGIGTTTPGWFTTVRNDDNLFSSANVVDESKFALVVLSQSGNDGDGVGIGLGNNTGGNQAGAGIVFKKTSTNSVGDLMLTVKEDLSSSGPQFPALTIKSVTGNVGIGTTSPSQAKLVINGSANSNVGGYGYLNSSGSTGTSSGVWSYSIYASHRVAALEFNAFSDARIKKVKGVSDSEADLATLASIKITDYQLIDSIAKGNKMIKKVIAQELEQVYPQAVSTHTDVIPDIYTRAEITNGYIALKNTLKSGEKVRLILPTGEELLEVATATENGFTVASNQTGPVFVYGREVNDFHTVDYEALTTLNISATQELLIQIQALQNKVVDLERENNNLKAEVQSIEDVKRDLDELKRLIYNSSANTSSEAVELAK
ncbi:MAG: tail fiber domain-containing protein [Fluviicola sp.]|nr:tail fiber domain-containing protein [Fluviicola sp.]